MSINRARLLSSATMVALAVGMLVVLRLIRGEPIEAGELLPFAIGTGLVWYLTWPWRSRISRPRDRG